MSLIKPIIRDAWQSPPESLIKKVDVKGIFDMFQIENKLQK